MENYYKIKASQQQLSLKLAKEKKRLHKQFVVTEKKTIRVMDILIIAMVLMNFGAVFITNFMVVRQADEQGKTITFAEVNPVQAEVNNYEPVPIEQSKVIIRMVLFQLFLWVILIGFYLHYRNTVFSDEGLFFMKLFLTIYFLLIGYDFFNDLGLLIGKVVFL